MRAKRSQAPREGCRNDRNWTPKGLRGRLRVHRRRSESKNTPPGLGQLRRRSRSFIQHQPGSESFSASERSATLNGPIAKPNASSAWSTSSGQAPSSSELALLAVGVVDAVADEAEGVTAQHRCFSQLLAEHHARRQHVRGEVCVPRTTSSSFITLAGLKKCRPSTSCGRVVAAAIASPSR